jgi:hypothetical protein
MHPSIELPQQPQKCPFFCSPVRLLVDCDVAATRQSRGLHGIQLGGCVHTCALRVDRDADHHNDNCVGDDAAALTFAAHNSSDVSIRLAADARPDDAVANTSTNSCAHACAHACDGLAVQLLHWMHPVC